MGKLFGKSRATCGKPEAGSQGTAENCAASLQLDRKLQKSPICSFVYTLKVAQLSILKGTPASIFESLILIQIDL